MIYDFDTNSWNRMRILGKGYKNDINGTLGVTQLSQEERRQAYSVDTDTGSGTFRRPTSFDDSTLNSLNLSSSSEPTIADLAPPALSGAVFVTRTYPRALRNAAGTVAPLKLPELFLIGGRSQDGKPQPLQDVWKLCVASPGERIPIDPTGTDDASCDHYEDSTNEDSPAPLIEYTGRWIHKLGTEPVGPLAPNAANQGAYLAAGAYDSQFDRIVIYGGINARDTGDSDFVGITSSSRTVNDEIFEYTPPSKINTTDAAEYHGTWSKIPHCLDSNGVALDTPTPRYGHSMSYDPIQKRLIVVGGFDENGSPLKQSISIDNPETTYDAPEVWTGTRIVEAGTYKFNASNDPSESNPCYAWRKITVFGNSTEITTALPPQTAIGHAASIYIPPTGYNTGYYSLFDDQCFNQGPFSGGDALISKQYAGGANIDLDRSALGERENLLLNLTYLPLGTKNQRPDGQLFSKEETAFFRIHLISTSESESKLLSALQPRHLWYTNDNQYPKVVHTLDVLASESGTPRTDQIVIPLGVDDSIDRIRIERVSGSAILIDAALFRLGPR
jgi:hypothetical protein